MTRKTKTNSNNNSEIKQIGANTQIIFTVKSFFTLVGTLLALFFGFYLIVVSPRFDVFEKMFNEQKELNETFTKEITDIKINMKIVSLQTNDTTIIDSVYNNLTNNNKNSYSYMADFSVNLKPLSSWCF